MAKAENIVGVTYNLLTVLNRVENGSDGRAMWLCRCLCGKEKIICGRSFRLGITKSCGCLSKAVASEVNSTHGLSKSIEYRSWAGIKNRCYNKNLKEYKNYGGRGIIVCKRWIYSFENFLKDMGNKPSPNHSIDRINTNGNYTPKNCRWATVKEQNRNQRTNIYYEYNGERKLQKDWLDYFNIGSANAIKYHLKKGRTIEYVFNKLSNSNLNK